MGSQDSTFTFWGVLNWEILWATENSSNEQRVSPTREAHSNRPGGVSML